MKNKDEIDEINLIKKEYSKFIINTSDYNKLKLIGKGGYAEVWLVQKTDSKEELALKELFSDITPKQVHHFVREIQTMVEANHPFFLKFLGFSPEIPLSIVSEYIPNGSLFKFIRSDLKVKKLNGTNKTLIAMGIASAMSSLHKSGIIHRDLKSMNILLDEDLMPKLCDFGIARFFSGSNEVITMRLGTPHWMAPESLYGKGYGFPVDVYSFSMVLYELLTYKIPWSGMDPVSVTRAVVIEKKRPKLPSNSPKGLKNMIIKCWQTNPDLRPSFQEIYRQFATGTVFFEGTDTNSINNLHEKLVSLGFEQTLSGRKKQINDKPKNNLTKNKPLTRSKLFIKPQKSLKLIEIEDEDILESGMMKIKNKNILSPDNTSDFLKPKGNLPSLSESDNNFTPLKPKIKKINLIDSKILLNQKNIINLSEISDINHPNFKEELFKISKNLNENQYSSFYNILFKHINSNISISNLKLIFKILKKQLKHHSTIEIFKNSNIHLNLPLKSELHFNYCLDFIHFLFSKDPCIFENNFNEKLIFIISLEPEKSLVLLQFISKRLHKFIDPWPLIDLLITESDWFLSSTSVIEYISTLFYLCKTFEWYCIARISSIMEIFLQCLTFFDRRVVVVAYNSIIYFSNYCNNIDYDLISRHLLDDNISQFVLPILIKLPPINISNDLIDSLLECSLSNTLSTLILLKLSESNEISQIILQNSWWISEKLPTLNDTLKLFLSIMIHSNLRPLFVSIPETYKFFQLLCNEFNNKIISNISSIIRRFPPSKQLLRSLSSSNTLNIIFKTALDNEEEDSIHGLLLLLQFLGNISYSNEYLLLIEKLKNLLKFNNSLAGMSLVIIAQLSQYKECAIKFKEIKLEKYFKKLLNDNDYKDYANVFLNNINLISKKKN